MLRELSDVISRPLFIVFESSGQLREVPEDRKKANVISIFKKGKQEDIGNYSLVNLTSILVKAIWELITESQDQRMVGVGRDLCGSSSPTTLPKQGHLQ